MKTTVFTTVMAILFTASFCFSQPKQGGMKPPPIKERIKMVEERICQPLKLDQAQTEKVASAFIDFFLAMDKLADKTANPPTRPEKSKVDPLAKMRDEKVKQAIPESLYQKYLELELQLRPKGPENEVSRPN
jgi:hypothetical protein